MKRIPSSIIEWPRGVSISGNFRANLSKSQISLALAKSIPCSGKLDRLVKSVRVSVREIYVGEKQPSIEAKKRLARWTRSTFTSSLSSSAFIFRGLIILINYFTTPDRLPKLLVFEKKYKFENLFLIKLLFSAETDYILQPQIITRLLIHCREIHFDPVFGFREKILGRKRKFKFENFSSISASLSNRAKEIRSNITYAKQSNTYLYNARPLFIYERWFNNIHVTSASSSRVNIRGRRVDPIQFAT